MKNDFNAKSEEKQKKVSELNKVKESISDANASIKNIERDINKKTKLSLEIGGSVDKLNATKNQLNQRLREG